jgi:ActR/RegA family two-component response regulator
MTNGNEKLVAVLDDLMFLVKIQEAAKRAGMDAIFVKSQADALIQAKSGPAMMILDLNYSPVQPLDLITRLKSKQETKGVRLLGYVSHVQIEVRQEAEKRGCDQVVARSTFVQDLPKLLGALSGSRA